MVGWFAVELVGTVEVGLLGIAEGELLGMEVEFAYGVLLLKLNNDQQRP